MNWHPDSPAPLKDAPRNPRPRRKRPFYVRVCLIHGGEPCTAAAFVTCPHQRRVRKE